MGEVFSIQSAPTKYQSYLKAADDEGNKNGNIDQDSEASAAVAKCEKKEGKCGGLTEFIKAYQFKLGVKDFRSKYLLAKALIKNGGLDNYKRKEALAYILIQDALTCALRPLYMGDRCEEEIWPKVVSLGSAAFPALKSVFQDEYLMHSEWEGYYRGRYKAIRTLGKIGHSSAIPFLREALKEDNAGIKEIAIWALGQTKDPSVIPDLKNFLKGYYYGIREAAVRALGKIKHPLVIPDLQLALKDDDSEVRALAAWAFRGMEELAFPAIPGLLFALKDQEQGFTGVLIREGAAIALGNIGVLAFPAVSALEVMANSKEEDEGVQKFAVRAIRRIKRGSSDFIIDEFDGKKNTIKKLADAIQVDFPEFTIKTIAGINAFKRSISGKDLVSKISQKMRKGTPSLTKENFVFVLQVEEREDIIDSWEKRKLLEILYPFCPKLAPEVQE